MKISFILIGTNRYCGFPFEIQVEERDDIKKAKDIIYSKIGLLPFNQSLIFAGKSLFEGRSFSEYGIREDGLIRKVFVITRLRESLSEFRDMSDRVGNHINLLRSVRVRMKEEIEEEIKHHGDNEGFQKICDISEEGPLVTILSFLDFISHCTNIPLVCRSFHCVSNMCLENEFIQALSDHIHSNYSLIGLFLGDKHQSTEKRYLAGESLLIKKFFRCCENTNFYPLFFSSGFIKFCLFERKYFKAAEYYVRKWGEMLKEKSCYPIEFGKIMSCLEYFESLARLNKKENLEKLVKEILEK